MSKKDTLNTDNQCQKTQCCKAVALIAITALIVGGALYLLSGKVISNWVAKNPELILESVINMQKQQAQQQNQKSNENISKKSQELFENSSDPVYNAKNYDVAIVEFFDYNCGYCKRAVATLEELIGKDKKVKIIFKELPILGQSSEDLAKVALAFNIVNPNKYFEFHAALMKSSARTTQAAIKIAQNYGVSAQKINNTLKNSKSKIEAIISQNRALASSIGVNGTPAFLVGENLFPGAVGYDTIKQAIDSVRE